MKMFIHFPNFIIFMYHSTVSRSKTGRFKDVIDASE